MATAAAAAILVAAIPLTRYLNRPAELTNAVAALPAPATPSRQISPTAPVAPVVHRASEPYVRFGHGVGETVATSFVYVPGLGAGPEGLDDTLPEPISSGLRPFRPLRNSMAAAVDAIRQAFPLSPEAGSTRS
jgi:hypothetical protein